MPADVTTGRVTSVHCAGMHAPILYVAAGLGVGGLIGLTGIGGGSLMTPVLVLGFGQSPAVAVGTDLAFAATTRFVASTPSNGPGQVDWEVVRRLAYGSVPAALAVLAAMWASPRASAAVDRWMLVSLAGMLLATAAGVLCQDWLRSLGLRLTAHSLATSERLKPALTILAGVGIGVAVTLTSVGAGAVASVLLASLYPLRLNGGRLVATDLAYALPLTVVAAAGHAALGHLDVGVLGLLLLGAVPGALLVQRAQWRIPVQVFRAILAVVLLACAMRILSL